jgi:release factor glutamine methyltransferase
VATRNVADHGVADRVELALGNLLADLLADHRFDYIVSNPPYVSTAEWETLAREVKDHEPQTALVAGPRGTEVIEPLVAQAAERLRPGGWLIIELSPMIVEAVEKILTADGRFSQITILKDIAGLPRVVQAQRENTA